MIQQSRLEKLEDALGSSAVVTYSSAAFLKKSELWSFQENGSIIENSNFVSSKILSGHSRYSFIASGHSGFANAEPTVIEDIPILKRIETAYERSEENFSVKIRNAGDAINKIMNEEKSEDGSLYSNLIRRFQESSSFLGDVDNTSTSLFKIMAFCTANSTSWYITTKPKR